MLGVLETARVLLRLEAVTARLEDWDIGAFDSASQAGKGGAAAIVSGLGLGDGFGGVGGMGAGGDGEGAGRLADEEEMAELSWKTGRLMEIFLSEEMQVGAVCVRARLRSAVTQRIRAIRRLYHQHYRNSK